MVTAFEGNRSTERKTKWQWPRQPCISVVQRKLWQRALSTHFLKTRPQDSYQHQTYLLRNPLGKCVAQPIWNYYVHQRSEELISKVPRETPRSHMKLVVHNRSRYGSFYDKQAEDFAGSVEWPEVIPAAVQVQAQGLYVTKSPGAVGLTKPFRDPGSITEYKALLAPGRRRFLALVEIRPLTEKNSPSW